MSLFPTRFFLSRWNNKVAQLQFLFHTCHIATELLTANNSISKFIISRQDFGNSPAGRYFVNVALQSCWNSSELVELLVEYSSITSLTEPYGRLLELALEQAPELVLFGFAKLDGGWSPLVKNLGPKLVVSIMTSHEQAPLILSKLWEISPMMFVAGLALMYLADNSTLSRALEIAQELKVSRI
jgi:hypothetical protein